MDSETLAILIQQCTVGDKPVATSILPSKSILLGYVNVFAVRLELGVPWVCIDTGKKSGQSPGLATWMIGCVTILVNSTPVIVGPHAMPTEPHHRKTVQGVAHADTHPSSLTQPGTAPVSSHQDKPVFGSHQSESILVFHDVDFVRAQQQIAAPQSRVHTRRRTAPTPASLCTTRGSLPCPSIARHRSR